MSIMMVPLTEVDNSISRPVIYEIARQVMERTNIPPDIRINFKDQAESVFQPGSEQGAANYVAPALAGDSQLYIDAIETPMLEMITTEDVAKDNTHPPLFTDDKLGIVVLPIKKQMDVVITFRLKSNSRTFAERWKNDIWARIANQRDLDMHTVKYRYPFPEQYIHLLRYFHGLREAVAGYNEDFDTYFANHADQSLTSVSNLSGSIATIQKPETQTRILGWFDFQGEPEKANKDAESSTWTTEFSYRFKYEKTTHAVIRFPVAIHNQMVDSRLFGRMQKLLEEKMLGYSKITEAGHFFETGTNLDRLMVRKPRQMRIPAHDTIAYTQYVPHTHTLCSVLVALDPESDILFNLEDMEDFGFNGDVLDYIRAEGYKWMTKPYACMLNVSLYRDHYLTDPKNLIIDEKLNVRAVAGTDIRKCNRVRIAFYDNITHVMPEALVRLNNHRAALRSIIKAGNTRPADIYRHKPRVDLTWLLDDLELRPDVNLEAFYDMNRTLDYTNVQLSHTRAHRMNK
jgi:hypothetical protein